MDEVNKWERRYQRERTARREAERLLEEKSLALYTKTVELDQLVGSQKELIADRTRDLEDLSAEAQLLSDAISHTENGVVITNPENKVIWANAAIAKISGYQIDDFIGKTPGELLQGHETDEVTRSYMREKIKAREAFDAEVLNYSKQGEPYWIYLQATPVFDEAGKFKYFIAIQSDITEARKTRLQLEREMKRANEMARQAKEANSAKTRFLATMSHELRTPLNGIIGYAQILEKTPSMDDKSVGQIGIMRRSGEHLLSLINDLLDISKIEAGSHNLIPSRFDLEGMLNSVLDIISSKAQEKELQLKLTYNTGTIVPQGSRARLYADSRALRQVLLNLLGNAIKFTETGTVGLEVHLLHYDGEHITIQFSITDTGRGIPEEKRDTLFDAFKQVDAERDVVQGSGLGLFIAQRLVQQMGNEIRVDSTKDVGSCFSFKVRFPMDFISRAKQHASESDETQKGFPDSYTGPERSILIIDDIKPNRDLLVDLLAPIGFKLDQAENGREALKKIKVQQYDLILSDVIMPYMSGYDLVKLLRATPELADNCVIAISASLMQLSAHEKSEMKNFDGFVAKPVQADELFDMLREKLQLEWGYSQHLNTTPTSKNDGLTSGNLIEQLHWFARIGDIKALHQAAPELKTVNPQLYQELKPLLNELKPQQMAQLLEKAL